MDEQKLLKQWRALEAEVAAMARGRTAAEMARATGLDEDEARRRWGDGELGRAVERWAGESVAVQEDAGPGAEPVLELGTATNAFRMWAWERGDRWVLEAETGELWRVVLAVLKGRGARWSSHSRRFEGVGLNY